MTEGHPRSKAEAEAERLLIEAAQKDIARFADLYEIHFHRVYAFISRRIIDRDQVEDLTSEVFHQALAALPRFEWRGAPFAAWLFKIAYNAIINHSSRSARDKKFAGRADTFEASPDEIVEIEQRAALFELVDRLPEDQRRVVLLRFTEDKSIREIAHKLSRSEGAVKQLQFRALQSLRTMEFGGSRRTTVKRTSITNG